MNKRELIQALKDATDLSKPEAASVVNTFFNGMADALANVHPEMDDFVFSAKTKKFQGLGEK